MSDLRTLFTKFQGDLSIVGPDLEEDDGLQTAVAISLFTDRRVREGEQLPRTSMPGDTALDRRGWWGDTFPPVEGHLTGSRLWTLAREKQTDAVVQRARDFALEALRWLLDDGIARAVNVTTEINAPGVLGLLVEVVRPDKPVAQYRFENFWRGA